MAQRSDVWETPPAHEALAHAHEQIASLEAFLTEHVAGYELISVSLTASNRFGGHDRPLRVSTRARLSFADTHRSVVVTLE